MRNIVLNTFLTLDGVMQAPGGPEEDPTGGFAHGGWSVNYWDKMMVKEMQEVIAHPFDLLLGRRTYEIFAAHWPYVKNDPDKLNQMAADALNHARKYVVSNTLATADWQNSVIIRGNVVDAMTTLKIQGGPDLQVHGSSNLIQTLLKHDLVDEIRTWIFPLVLGTGKRLFVEGTIPMGIKLLDCKTSSTGVIIAHYLKDDRRKAGSLELETPTGAEIARRERLKDEGSAG